MQAHSARTLRTGIIAEPGAAHLDHYLESIAPCQGIGPLAYADPTGETLGQARRLLGPLETYTSPARMLEELRPRLAIILLEAPHGPHWIPPPLPVGSHALSEKHPAANTRDLEPVLRETESP